MVRKNISSEEQDVLPKPGRSDERRQDLVVAAYHLIAEKGFEGLRVRDVAARAGVNIATLHYYFNSKEDLIRGVVNYMVSLFLSTNTPVADEEKQTASQKLQRIFLDLHYQLQQAPELFGVFIELHLRSQRDPTVRAILKELNDGWQTHIETICREGIREGTFRSDLDSRRAASTLIALIKGIGIQTTSQLDAFNFERMAIEIEQGLANPGAKTFIPPKGRKGT